MWKWQIPWTLFLFHYFSNRLFFYINITPWTQPRHFQITWKLSGAKLRSHNNSESSHPDHTKSQEKSFWVSVWYKIASRWNATEDFLSCRLPFWQNTSVNIITKISYPVFFLLNKPSKLGVNAVTCLFKNVFVFCIYYNPIPQAKSEKMQLQLK